MKKSIILTTALISSLVGSAAMADTPATATITNATQCACHVDYAKTGNVVCQTGTAPKTVYFYDMTTSPHKQTANLTAGAVKDIPIQGLDISSSFNNSGLPVTVNNFNGAPSPYHGWAVTFSNNGQTTSNVLTYGKLNVQTCVFDPS